MQNKNKKVVDEINDEINAGWEMLHQLYEPELKNVLKKNKIQENEDVIFDFTNEIQDLYKKILTKDQEKKIEDDIKNLLMKCYWNGFMDGFNNCKENSV